MNIHEQIKKSENIIYQDSEIIIVLDIDPISKGHVLILPQKHYKDIDELPKELLIRIMMAARKYIELIKEKYKPVGYSMMQNGGEYNEIDVFHLHVFPRFNKDEFNWMNNPEKIDKIDIEEMRNQLELKM